MQNWTDKKVDDKGARTLGEALKTNTTLHSLNLTSRARRKRGISMNYRHFQQQQTGNYIGAEGAKALSETLKTNTTLQSLNLGREQEESDEDG